MTQTRYAWYDPRRWPSLLVAFLTLLLMFLLSGVIVSIGIRIAGSLEAFQAGMAAAQPLLLVWRLLFYGAMAWLWYRHWRPRVIRRLNRDRDGGEQARPKLEKLERLVLVLVALLEVMNFTNWLGGA
ncbi:hypothetical protein L861_06695 [Litchfieldella anticariensis FP35 = DSM 16096]|uniref:Uncharacterized protein n=1 Tax=Litchfieldella anticariensis (strain DSM 16096 / CECT 5854 / CIP 108499 / LMG 22089 / FP35) TaxID=1121939 RepID=S2KJP1_LITA3|nr:hypothetical protein [Halomonas anticariensis]EPC00623.1 hypothetical protein L861_06695 [Halomonas anticariensis FP35 = DSM 16096]